MPRVVHITSTSSARAILRSGIRPGPSGVIFFMPMIMGHQVAHQWARELKRSGVRCFSAVHVDLPGDALVWHGRYNEAHIKEPLSAAIAKFRLVEDTMGYEFFCEGRIDRALIQGTKEIAKPLGWRYDPKAHGRKPCACPACLTVGEYGSSERRRRYAEEYDSPMPMAEARRVLTDSDDVDLLYRALGAFSSKTRREDPRFLFRLLAMGDEFLSWQTLTLIGRFAHPEARAKLLEYIDASDPDVREQVRDLLTKRGWSSSLATPPGA